MTRIIDAHRERFGVEPICRELQVAPSTYYAARCRKPSARRVRDEALKLRLRQVHDEHFEAYGARKMWRQLRREDVPVARCTVERLMCEAGALRRGAWETEAHDRGPTTRARPGRRTSWSATSGRRSPTGSGSPTSPTCARGAASPTSPSSSTPARATSSAGRPRARCAPTSHSTRSSRRCGLGRRTLRRARLRHHSDRGVQYLSIRRPLEPEQYLSIRYTERLDEAGAVTSVGSRGDSYDNALAE